MLYLHVLKYSKIQFNKLEEILFTNPPNTELDKITTDSYD